MLYRVTFTSTLNVLLVRLSEVDRTLDFVVYERVKVKNLGINSGSIFKRKKKKEKNLPASLDDLIVKRA